MPYETKLHVHVERINEGPRDEDHFDAVATSVEITEEFLHVRWKDGGKSFSSGLWESVTIKRETKRLD